MEGDHAQKDIKLRMKDEPQVLELDCPHCGSSHRVLNTNLLRLSMIGSALWPDQHISFQPQMLDEEVDWTVPVTADQLLGAIPSLIPDEEEDDD